MMNDNLDKEHWFKKGESFFEKEKFEEALINYDNALRIDNHYFKALLRKAEVLRLLNRDNEAFKVLKIALKLDPNNIEVMFNMGAVLLRMGKYKKAIKYYQKIQNINPNIVNVYLAMAKAYEGLGDKDRERESYKNALKYIDEFDLLVDFIIVLMSKEEYPTAEKYADKAIELNSEDKQIWYLKSEILSCYLCLLDDKERSLNSLKRSIELDSKYKIDAKEDEDFEKLWNDPEFIAITE